MGSGKWEIAKWCNAFVTKFVGTPVVTQGADGEPLTYRGGGARRRHYGPARVCDHSQSGDRANGSEEKRARATRDDDVFKAARNSAPSAAIADSSRPRPSNGMVWWGGPKHELRFELDGLAFQIYLLLHPNKVINTILLRLWHPGSRERVFCDFLFCPE